jgi:hypothetical protein
MPATLRVTRKHPLTELRRGPFEIALDGKSIGSIDKDDETSEIPVEAGHHTLRIGSGRSSSPEHSFESPTVRSSTSGLADPWSGQRTSRP